MESDLIRRSALREQMERAFMLASVYGRKDPMLSVVNDVITAAPYISLRVMCPRCGAWLALKERYADTTHQKEMV